MGYLSNFDNLCMFTGQNKYPFIKKNTIRILNREN